MSRRMAFFSEPDAVIDKTLFWTPPIPPMPPPPREPGRDLHVGFVGSRSLFEGLNLEARLSVLDEETAVQTVAHGRLDLLMVESCWFSVNGGWGYALSFDGPQREALVDTLVEARKLGVPTVYWVTHDLGFHTNFLDLADRFDAVYCADPRVVPILRKRGVHAGHLAPAVSTALYNPYRSYVYRNAFGIDALLNGWVDVYKRTREFQFVNDLASRGLRIIESRFLIWKSKLGDSAAARDAVLGCVSSEDMRLAYAYARCGLMFDKTCLTPTTQHWRFLKMAACGLPVLYCGIPPENFPVNMLAKVVDAPEDLPTAMEALLRDELGRSRTLAAVRRSIGMGHSLAHRMAYIRADLKLGHTKGLQPSVVMVADGRDAERQRRVIEQFSGCDYPRCNLLILAPEAKDADHQDLTTALATRDDVSVFRMSPEADPAAVLPQAIRDVDSEYLLFMASDIDYQKQYVTDMVVNAQSCRADFFGKPKALTYDSVTRSEIMHNEYPPTYCRIPLAFVRNNAIKSSLGGKTSFFKKSVFKSYSESMNEFCPGPKDYELMYTFGCFDQIRKQQ